MAPIDWVEHKKGESISEYSLRLINKIDTSQEFSVLGVSFGGLIAVEVSKIINPKYTILISSIETKEEISWIYRAVGKVGLTRFLPSSLFDPPRRIAKYLFGAFNYELLNNILDDTNLDFTKWALNVFITWSNKEKLKNVIRIHGTKDKLIPWKSKSESKLIDNGEHFMIVDRAAEISEIINFEIKT
ncbi:alpha/beta hydrolase [Muricauda sp. 2012CJ35-5]|uniref:Alpha/beta hydrolase n=1 Tax=Flagellimonas spongiicola TaxID=2942208 RepID=A0ABT0PRN6_9FLAO|nr:alpha/beta hydrolase [Allomuricauda spongiicola]MCL6274028.1 alpha/beta hydrolase [Allomuricauda spongiicola]